VTHRFYAQPWGFAIEDVQVPVRLWHGKQDALFSIRLADRCKTLPNYKRVSLMRPDTIRCHPYMREILKDLICSADGVPTRPKQPPHVFENIM